VVVGYAVEQRIARGKPDDWDHATRLELAVLARDSNRVSDALSDALASMREDWEEATTANNLRMIREDRASRGDPMPSADQIEKVLLEHKP
jgi:hypothetical protein